VFEYNGMSMICGPRGEVLAQADARGEELIIADVPREPAGTYLADRRADLYGAETPHQEPGRRAASGSWTGYYGDSGGSGVAGP
jgi:hypothetical protein